MKKTPFVLGVLVLLAAIAPWVPAQDSGEPAAPTPAQTDGRPTWLPQAYSVLKIVGGGLILWQLGLALSLFRTTSKNASWGIELYALENRPVVFTHQGDLHEGQSIRSTALWSGTMATLIFLAVPLDPYGIYVNHQAALERILGGFDVIPVVKYAALVLFSIVVSVACYRRGLWLDRNARQLIVTPDEVQMLAPGRSSEHSWREPLANYSGVVATKEVRNTDDSISHVLVLELAHPNPEKTIPLVTRECSDGSAVEEDAASRHTWESCARMLGVPAVLEASGGMTVREAGDLDKTAGELVQEGKIAPDFDAGAPVPDGVEVVAEGDTTVVTVRAAPFPLVIRGWAVGISGYLALEGLTSHAYGLLVFAIPVILIAALWKGFDARLRIERDALRLCVLRGRRESELLRLPFSEIREIKVQWRWGGDFPSGTSFLILFNAYVVAVFELHALLLAFVTKRIKGGENTAGEAAVHAETRLHADTGTRSVKLITDKESFALPARMKTEAAEWLRGLILSLMASAPREDAA